MDNYPLAYRAYHDATDQQENNLASLQQQIPTALKKLRLGEDRATFKILSIGAGDGFMDQEILKIVQEGYLKPDKQSRKVKVLNTAVEPNTELLGQYKASIEERHEGEWSIEFDLKPMSFEKYAESKHDPNQYDMVHAIHSLYYVENMEATLKHLYHNELRETGLILCLLGNELNPPGLMSVIFEKCRPGYKRKSAFDFNAAAKFIRLAEKNSIRHEKVVIPYSLDVTSVFDNSSDEGSHLLDFLTHEDNYRQKADQDEVTKVLKEMRDKYIEDDDSRLIWHGANEVILVYKTSL